MQLSGTTEDAVGERRLRLLERYRQSIHIEICSSICTNAAATFDAWGLAFRFNTQLGGVVFRSRVIGVLMKEDLLIGDFIFLYLRKAATWRQTAEWKRVRQF